MGPIDTPKSKIVFTPSPNERTYSVYADEYDMFQILFHRKTDNVKVFFCEFKTLENAQYVCDLLNKEVDRVSDENARNHNS